MLTHTGRHFLRDGQQHLIVSGAIHYSRVHPDQWSDRLRRIRAMGANTIETYVPWNFHAPDPTTKDLTGPRDLGRFLDLATEQDLDVIVRPGPYVCAEWEGGGLPGWLLADPALRLRCHNEAFLTALDAWFDVLIPVVAERQYPRGGRVVMVQVENEYGSFGEDKEYLAHIRDGLIARGIDVMLVTSDGPGLAWLSGGIVDGVLPTLNFGSRHREVLDLYDAELPDVPRMCMEFWNGWFDHWGEAHHARPAADAAAELDGMLAADMSVNFYMAHGGTNFGLWNGCNYDGTLQPTVTSYDYDAPIAENGALTEKFHAYREVIGKYLELPDLPEDLAAAPATLPARELDETGSGLWGIDDLRGLSEATVPGLPGLRIQQEPTPYPPTFEDLGLERGLLLLSTELHHHGGTAPLRLHGLRDRAHVFCDGRLVATVCRDEGRPETVDLTAERGTHRLDIVVESLGRINFGPLLGDRKGILRGVWFGTRFLMGWQAWPIPLDLIGAHVAAKPLTTAGADGFRVQRFVLPVTGDQAGTDAFLDTSELERAFVLVGDDLIGRHWDVGPQQTLYVPGPLLPAGDNIITVLSTDGNGGGLRTTTEHVLDGPVKPVKI